MAPLYPVPSQYSLYIRNLLYVNIIHVVSIDLFSTNIRLFHVVCYVGAPCLALGTASWTGSNRHSRGLLLEIFFVHLIHCHRGYIYGHRRKIRLGKFQKAVKQQKGMCRTFHVFIALFRGKWCKKPRKRRSWPATRVSCTYPDVFCHFSALQNGPQTHHCSISPKPCHSSPAWLKMLWLESVGDHSAFLRLFCVYFISLGQCALFRLFLLILAYMSSLLYKTTAGCSFFLFI